MSVSNHRMEKAYRDYKSIIFRYIRSRIICPETAADLTQDTFIRFFRADKNSIITEARAYLYRVARNIVIDHVRSASILPAPKFIVEIDEAANLADERPPLDDILESRAQVAEISKAVSTLTRPCQRIFWLSRFYGFKNREIAEREGVCLSTVEKNISKALKLCHQRFVV